MIKHIYLDHNATTPIADEVKWKMQRALWTFGNASSMHADGREALRAVEGARVLVAELIGARPEEVIFTSGGSESNNMVLNTMWGLIHRGNERNEIIVSQIEHPSILEMAKFLESLGLKVHYLPVDKLGRVVISELEKVLSSKTLLVSVMSANNEIGTVQDVVKITTLAKKAGALVHTDATQTIGRIPVDIRELNVDYLTLSAHKIYGPKGIGALFVRSGAPIAPLIFGGHQEKSLRAGTYNTLGTIGFGEAALLTKKTLKKYEKIEKLRDRLQELILKRIPHTVVNGDGSLPNTLNVSFAGAEGESILLALDHVSIEVSTGSACASGDARPSHVLMAIHADPELAHGSIRFSFGLENTMSDVNSVMRVLPEIVKRLRAMSTVGVK